MAGKGRKTLEKREVSRELYMHVREAIRKAAKDDWLLDEFLKDLLTPAEYAEVATRWQIVRLLANGHTQREITKRLHISIETVSRGARELADKNGGFWKILNMK